MMQPACTVGYYAGGIGTVATEEPACPVLLHFGAEDSHIGPEQVEAVRQAHAGHNSGEEVTIYIYEGAQHGFNCDMRSAFTPRRQSWRERGPGLPKVAHRLKLTLRPRS